MWWSSGTVADGCCIRIVHDLKVMPGQFGAKDLMLQWWWRTYGRALGGGRLGVGKFSSVLLASSAQSHGKICPSSSIARFGLGGFIETRQTFFDAPKSEGSNRP